MDIGLLIFLSLTIILTVNIARRKIYKITFKCAVAVSLLEIFFGVLGTMLLFLIENGVWGGRSFFGAVMFLPIIFIFVSKLLKTSYGAIMDFIAPSGLSMFAVNKLNCYIASCCGGRNIGFSPEGIPYYFPSQLVEMSISIVIVLTLMFIEKKKSNVGTLYPLGLIAYGVTRFVLNFFREEWAVYDGGMIPWGTVWSVVSVIAGVIWLIVLNGKKSKEDASVTGKVSNSI